MTIALISALHYLALGIGLGSLFMRGVYIRALQKGDQKAVKPLLVSDNFWGLAAVLWLGTGLTRAFGGMEKQSEFYLKNHMFHLKMGLFLLVFILEIYPMMTFIKWRIQKKISGNLLQLKTINNIELVLVLLIPFVASLMARGIGF